MEYYSGIKINEIMPSGSNMDGPTGYHTKWTKKEEGNIIWCHLHGESKNWYKWTYLQNRHRFTDIQNKPMVTKGERKWGVIRSLRLANTNYYT